MNDYQVQVRQWTDIHEANKGLYEFIQGCNDNDVEILDITSHVTETDICMTYVFIFKVRW